jgi:predicted extracellular nuclease
VRRTPAGVAIAALALTAPLLAVVPAAQAAPSPDSPVVINEVYGGGGNSGATWRSDFVELHNTGATAVDLSTWTVQYKSGTGTTWSGKAALTGSIQPGRSYLVQLATGTGGTQDLPTPDATGTIAMSGTGGTVALVSDATTLTCTLAACATAEPVVDLVGWGSSTTTFLGTGPAPTTSNTTSVSRTGFVNTVDNAADFTAGAPSPVNSGTNPDPDPDPDPELGECGDPATAISDIQGSGTTFDPAFGGAQVVEGVVSAVKPGLGGFYVQEEAADVDDDAATSEGIFVYLGTGVAAPEVGRTVRVAGTVAEFGSNGSVTQLTDPEVGVCDVPVTDPVATAVTFPLPEGTTLERYEGMLVTFEQDLVISEYFNYARFGEVVAALPPNGWDRLHTPTAVVEPGAEAIALAELYSRSVVTIDDSSTAQNPAALVHPGNGQPYTLQNSFRGGDTVTGVTGVIDNSFGLYRVHPTAYGEYAAVNPRPAAPEVGGDLQVASFNVLNYFLTLDDGTNDVCGANQDQECRGADDAEELERQRAKIVAALADMDADVVGLMEMENTPGVEPAADLADGLNDLLGEGTYDYVDTGVVGTDAIRLGLLYKPGSVTPTGAFDVLDSTDDPRFDDGANRPMISQTFDAVADGARFTVSVNHLKSKGSACAGDPDTGDGAGNCNLTRTAAAEAIVDHLAGDPTGSGDTDFLVIGDLNSYDMEDPIDVLVDAGYTDEIKRFGGEYAYGYVFDGQVGYLDHALASSSLDPQVTGAQEWHLNADEPSVLDYDTSFKPAPVDALYAPDPYRSSDHDAVLVGLDLQAPYSGPTCFGLPVTIRGTSGDDVLNGTPGRDVIWGGGGDDTINGRAGDDVICAGGGDDLVIGGPGNDLVTGNGGDDEIQGGLGQDVLWGGAGADLLLGGADADELYGEAGADWLEGGAGVDVLDGGPGRDVEIQ